MSNINEIIANFLIKINGFFYKKTYMDPLEEDYIELEESNLSEDEIDCCQHINMAIEKGIDVCIDCGEEITKKIENTKEFPTNVSALCDYCGYKNKCPSFKHQVELEVKAEESKKKCIYT